MAITTKQIENLVRGMVTRWKADESRLERIFPQPRAEFGDAQEMLRNLGSAIAHGERYVGDA